MGKFFSFGQYFLRELASSKEFVYSDLVDLSGDYASYRTDEKYGRGPIGRPIVRGRRL